MLKALSTVRWQRRALALNLSVLVLASCGGSQLPHASSITVTITPSQASVQVGGTVALAGNATGFTAGPIVRWWVQDSTDRFKPCGKLDPEPEDFTGCPNGIVMFHDVTTVPSTATYYAPLTPGTYHVMLEMTQVSTFDNVTKEATATIVVTR